MSDLARTIAFAFRRKGVETMPGSELRLLLAYDLRWFAPEDAKKVVLRAIETGMLEQEGDAVRVAFDLATVQIPLNFRPTTAVLDEEIGALPQKPMPSLAASVAAPAPGPAPAPPPPAPAQPPVAGAGSHQRAADDERRKRGLLVSAELAQLIVRRRAGEDVAEEAARLEERLLAAAQVRSGA